MLQIQAGEKVILNKPGNTNESTNESTLGANLAISENGAKELGMYYKNLMSDPFYQKILTKPIDLKGKQASHLTRVASSRAGLNELCRS